MTYKETLFFVGKCLTITHEEHNRLEVEQELKNGQVDWDAVVKVSTAQYVFPALYCNLKRANFLHYLPEELVNYMVHITDLNRERNQQIIEQANEINTLLLANNVTPIFLKGTAFLLQDFYEDIAERMVGDIDFLVSEIDYYKTANILKKDNYKCFNIKIKYHPKFHKHYNNLIKEKKIASVEIHRMMIIKPHHSFFNYNLINNDIFTRKNINFLSLKNQLILTILAKQINDYSFYLKNIHLRSIYDIFIISKKVSTSSIKKNHFKNILNSFLHLSSEILNYPKSIIYTKNDETQSFVKKTFFLIEKKNINTVYIFFIKNYFNITKNFKIIIKSFYIVDYKLYIIDRIKSKFIK